MATGGGGGGDFYGEFGGVGAEPVAVDLHGVAAGGKAGVGEDLQDLRAVAEGVGSESEPTIGKIGGEIYGAGRGVRRRAGLDLRRAGGGGICGELRAEFELGSGAEILA